MVWIEFEVINILYLVLLKLSRLVTVERVDNRGIGERRVCVFGLGSPVKGTSISLLPLDTYSLSSKELSSDCCLILYVFVKVFFLVCGRRERYANTKNVKTNKKLQKTPKKMERITREISTAATAMYSSFFEAIRERINVFFGQYFLILRKPRTRFKTWRLTT